MNAIQTVYPQKDRWSYLWLLAATVLSLFSTSSGRWLIPITAWLGAIFYLRFFRTQRRGWLAYLLTAVSVAVATGVMMPSSSLGALAVPVIIAAGLIGTLPLLADRWLAPRLHGRRHWPGLKGRIPERCAETVKMAMGRRMRPSRR
jgi:hypothetical protein